MVDNVNVTPGTGATIATDEVGGFHHQRVKPVWGPDGTVNDVDVASGKPLPVPVRASTGQVLSDATGILISTAQLGAIGPAAAAACVPSVPPTDYALYAPSANLVSGAITTAMTATTSTQLLAAPGVGLRNYITTIIVSNAHATVGTDVVITDGGTTLMTIPAAAAFGGAVITLPTPLRQPTTNTAINCANVITGSLTKVSAVGYKAA